MSENGSRIRMDNGKLNVPNDPIIPFIEGDGIGPDIWRSAVRVFDAAIEKAYNNERKIHWLEVYAGEKAFKKFNNWLPDETIEKCKEYLVSIKGPLSTPIGGEFVRATLIFTLLSSALNCSNLFFNSFPDCLKFTKSFKVSK